VVLASGALISNQFMGTDARFLQKSNRPSAVVN
jgi:hypothetical protein